MALFDTLKTILTPYAEAINLHAADIHSLLKKVSCLNSGEVSLDGEVIQGLYPVINGTMSAGSTSARTAVFPVESNMDYYVSWLPGSNKYRIAFGDIPADQLVDGSTIYGYIDANTLSHDHLLAHNDTHSYMYVYIGSSVSATIDAISVVKKTPSIIDDCFAQDNTTW